jgi:hypothetical protein
MKKTSAIQDYLDFQFLLMNKARPANIGTNNFVWHFLFHSSQASLKFVKVPEFPLHFYMMGKGASS